MRSVPLCGTERGYKGSCSTSSINNVPLNPQSENKETERLVF